MRLPSGSQLGRAIACPRSLTLPHVYTAEEDEDAQAGTIIHKFLETARTDRRAALAAITDDSVRQRCAAIDLATIPAGAEAEVAVGWHPELGATRYDLGQRRRYPADGRYHATLDLIGLGDGYVWVADYKSGLRVMRAEDSWQLRFGAVAAARLAGVRFARVALLYLGFSGEWYVDTAEWDSYDLDEAEAQIAALPGRATDDRTPFVIGPHCRYCPALMACPAQTDHIRALAADPGSIETALEPLTPEQCGEVWSRLKAIEPKLEAMLEGLKTMARQTPIPLPDGRVLKEIPFNKRALKSGALSRLADLVGLDPVLAAATMTPAAVERQFGGEALNKLESAEMVIEIPGTQVRAVGGAGKRAGGGKKKGGAITGQAALIE